MYVTLHSSTCFEQHAAHRQEDQLYHHSLWYHHSSQTAVQYAGGERTAVRSPPAYCTAAYIGWRYQRLWWYNLSSWGWAACCSKNVEERSVTYIIYCWKIKELWIKLVIWKIPTADMLYMFRTPFASIIRSTTNCNSSHWRLSWVGME